ncbi:MAG: response regulator [Chloroflexi bacterium]|nr:response regulator [Chloroflexota bacterium]
MQKVLNLLLVEDRAADAELMLMQLRHAGLDFESNRVHTEAEFLGALRPDLDLILLDYSLPQFSAPRALELLRGSGLGIPCIVVTGALTDEQAVDCMKLGAADYVLKDRIARLGAAVQLALDQRKLRLEKEAADRALAQSEELFRLLVEKSRDVVVRFRVSPPGWEYVSPAVTRLTGYAPEEWYADPELGLKIVHPEDRPHVEEVQRHVPDSHTEYRIIHKDGRVRWIDTDIVPIRDTAGTLVALQGVVRDITDRKLAEQEQARLREVADQEHQRLAAVVGASPAAIVVAGVNGELLLVNREAQQLFRTETRMRNVEDFARAAVARRTDGSVYAAEDLPLYRALYRGEVVHLEEVLREFPDGRTVTNLISATPIYSEQGQIVGAIAVAQDMGPLKEAEQRRNEFLGIISHELRTPLTAIKGAAATALSSRMGEDSETRELFQIIDRQSDKLRDLINNLLDLTRIEVGTLSITAMPADLGAVVREAVGTFTRGGAPQDVQVRLPDALPRVQADGRRVAQVIANLLGNAAKFSPPSLPIVLETESDASYVTVRVRDRGRGIPADKLPLLFKKFSQVHEDSARALAGTGLGLVICKGIVEAHGGRIWAESQGEGQGATFSFTLPVARGGPLVPPAETARQAEHASQASPAAARGRILSVDDDPQTLRYIQRTLEEAGYKAIVTADPVQCIKLVEEQQPDLAILDIVLPGTSGFDLLTRIREFSGLPVIFLTGTDQGANTVRALKMGADDYITKPFSPTELLARIEVVLRRRVARHVAEVRPPFTLGDLTINFAERRVLKGGRQLSLSPTEYKLLYQLAVHAGQVLTHDQLLEQVWGPEYKGEAELLRSMMRNLRRSLGDDARQPRYILTEPQVGYRMPRP